ncbi:MAG TPA: UbiH/UbiF family hydroxylase [Bauldia sp.]|nr:UbiH/UbiF family hydroxylase [Bauldia sp.]
MSLEQDIIVVGVGPAGLAAAIEAHRRGHSVAVVAPARAGRDERTAALLAGSIDLLDGIGIWPLVADKAAPLRTLRIVDATRRLFRAPEVTFHASEIGLTGFGFNVANADLVEALETRVSQLGIGRYATTVEGVFPGVNDIALALASGAQARARLVVAADGRRSTIRDRLGIGTREWRYDQSALVANLTHSLPHNDTSTEFHTEAGPFTLVPLPGRRSSLVWVDRPDEVTRRLGLPEAALAQEIEEQSSSLLGAIGIEGPRQAFPLSGMTANAFAASRTVLVGEAAHVFPPIGAQGLNLGYRDVAALGDILPGPGRDPGAPARLAAYERARRADVLTRTAAVDALNRTLLTGFLPVQALRGFGLFLLDRIPSLRQAVMRQGIAPGRPAARLS